MRFLLPLLCLALASCEPAPITTVETAPPSITLPASIPELTPTQAAEWMSQNPSATLLDLRMPEEVTREGKLPGSQNYDYLQSTTLEKLGQLDHQKPYLLYCALGGRAKRAALQMNQLGFPQIVVLKGGLNAWMTEGHPVIK
ncbi:MAG: rhodanese-like domain-containing protein [Prosthecobacter sp.]|nr:rhodanese-like domain-containing protein [Prosthecobacter sp.]